MEKYNLVSDINVVCVQAGSFPNGIMAAHQKLHALIPDIKQRRVFGISRPEGAEIIYKAAAELGEGDRFDHSDLERFTIKKGKYLAELITDFMNDVPKIGKTFQKLIRQPDIDPEGYCIEEYINENDVRCMVGINKEK